MRLREIHHMKRSRSYRRGTGVTEALSNYVNQKVRTKMMNL